MKLSTADPRHGTRSGYRKHGCRCSACRAANADAVRQWRQTNPSALERERIQMSAYHRAEKRLREAHRAEFEALYAEERGRIAPPPGDGPTS